MTDAQQYTIRCPHCGDKTPAGEDMLGQRVMCPACLETFLVPAFPDPNAGVEPIVPAVPESDPDLDEDAANNDDAAEPSETEESEEVADGTWPPSVVGLVVALVSIACLVIYVVNRGESIEVDPLDIVIVDRDVQRISDSEVKWLVTVINRADVEAELRLELEIYNVQGDVIYRDQTPDFTMRPGRMRKLRRTSDYFSGDGSRALRYEVLPKLLR